jgi:hypothetical protein
MTFDKLKCLILSNVHPIDGLFICLWLFGWFHNAEQAIKYDLDKLKDLYIWVRGYITATHGINSGLNTPIPGVQRSGENESSNTGGHSDAG